MPITKPESFLSLQKLLKVSSNSISLRFQLKWQSQLCFFYISSSILKQIKSALSLRTELKSVPVIKALFVKLPLHRQKCWRSYLWMVEHWIIHEVLIMFRYEILSVCLNRLNCFAIFHLRALAKSPIHGTPFPCRSENAKKVFQQKSFSTFTQQQWEFK